MFRLRHFTIVCNTNEHKMMRQDDKVLVSCMKYIAQLRTLETPWSGLFVYHDTSVNATLPMTVRKCCGDFSLDVVRVTWKIL
jgi:hypothetical protein